MQDKKWQEQGVRVSFTSKTGRVYWAGIFEDLRQSELSAKKESTIFKIGIIHSNSKSQTLQSKNRVMMTLNIAQPDWIYSEFQKLYFPYNLYC